MKTKIEPIFLYEGLGFPIELKNVQMINLNDEWHPKIDVHYIADEVIKKLPFQEERFSGNQVKFIRSYFSMSLREFGETVVKESHSAVSKWENHGENITNMNENTELCLRLYIIEKKQTKAQQKTFYSKYRKSKDFVKTDGRKPKCIQLNRCA